MADRYKVYWQPGCSSCLRAKEFLAANDIPYDSINVRAEPDAMADLALMEGVSPHGYLTVSGGKAKEITRALAREEGIFAGFSAGANVAAALELLAGPERGGVVGVLICDSGLKYLSTDLWEEG